MRAEERRSDVESELASDDPPTDLDDMVFFDEEESREVVVTSAEYCGPAAMSAGGEQEAAWRAAVPVTEPTNYMKLSKKIIRLSRRFSKLKPI